MFVSVPPLGLRWPTIPRLHLAPWTNRFAEAKLNYELFNEAIAELLLADGDALVACLALSLRGLVVETAIPLHLRAFLAAFLRHHQYAAPITTGDKAYPDDSPTKWVEFDSKPDYGGLEKWSDGYPLPSSYAHILMSAPAMVRCAKEAPLHCPYARSVRQRTERAIIPPSFPLPHRNLIRTTATIRIRHPTNLMLATTYEAVILRPDQPRRPHTLTLFIEDLDYNVPNWQAINEEEEEE